MQEVLYRFFDSEGTLLYVGISNDWMSRLRHHEQHSDFFSAVAGVTFERHPDRPSVAAAELAAIKTEDPLFNRAGNPNYQTWQTHFREVLGMCLDRSKVDNKHRLLVRDMLHGCRDEENFGTGKWFSTHFPAEWHHNFSYYDFDCEMCQRVASHPTTHAWGFTEQEA